MGERRNISPIERLALKKAWKGVCAYCETSVDAFEIDHIVAHANGGTCDLDNLCVTCSSCNRRKLATPLPKMYEGLLLSLATRRAKKVKEIIETATQKASKPKKRKVAEKILPKKRVVECIEILDTSFIAHLSLSRLSEAHKLLTLILSKDITEKREARWPETLPPRIWFESEFVLPHGITNPKELLAEIAYFGRSNADLWDMSPQLSFQCITRISTGEMQFRFKVPMKKLQQLKQGISNVLNQAKEAA